jgi:hypothetical protein
MNARSGSRYFTILLFCMPLTQCPVLAQNKAFFPQDAVPASPTAGRIPAGSTIQTALFKALDARKNKVGEEVIAKVRSDFKVGDKVVVAKGSKIVGHLTEAKTSSKENQESVVTITFDHAVLKDGGEIPLTVTIQALGMPADDRSGDMSDLMRGANGSGITGTQGNDPALLLTPDMHGIMGYRGLELLGSTITSHLRNVHLDSGTQMILQVSGK